MKRVNNAAYNNEWYKKELGASAFKRVMWFLTNAVLFINPVFAASRFKCNLLRFFGAKIGKGVVIKPGVNIKYPWKLVVGDHSWIGEKVWIDNLATVYIGNSVCISQGAMILTGNHNYKSEQFDLIIGEVTLQDGVWIGAKSMVCPGVSCGTHAVLSVYSVATGNLLPYTIYQGNPAVAVRDRQIL